MRSWQVLWISAHTDGSFTVMYLLNGKERRRAIVRPILGLDKAISDMGNALASLPPFKRAPVGNGKE